LHFKSLLFVNFLANTLLFRVYLLGLFIE